MNTLARSPVSGHLVSPVVVVLDTDRLAHAEQELTRLGVSAIPAVDRAGALVGVISRTDLLRAGHVRLMNGHRRRALVLPNATVREYMTAKVELVPATAALAEVARRMVRGHIHRLYISEDRRPRGVVSTKEITHAVAAARIATPVAELMRRSIVSVNADDPLSLAIDRMAAAHHSGLVVLEDGWPVGVFTQADALAARDAPPAERVDLWMDACVISVPMSMPLFRAAEQILATRARQVLAVDGAGTRGILTGMDFARLVATQESGTD